MMNQAQQNPGTNSGLGTAGGSFIASTLPQDDDKRHNPGGLFGTSNAAVTAGVQGTAHADSQQAQNSQPGASKNLIATSQVAQNDKSHQGHPQDKSAVAAPKKKKDVKKKKK